MSRPGFSYTDIEGSEDKILGKKDFSPHAILWIAPLPVDDRTEENKETPPNITFISEIGLMNGQFNIVLAQESPETFIDIMQTVQWTVPHIQVQGVYFTQPGAQLLINEYEIDTASHLAPCALREIDFMILRKFAEGATPKETMEYAESLKSAAVRKNEPTAATLEA